MSDAGVQQGAELDPRVALAAERTLLAWIRTGISLMALGFVVARFGAFLRELAPAAAHPPFAQSKGPKIGLAIVALGVLMNVWASLRHRQMVLHFRRGGTSVGFRGPLAIGFATGFGGAILLLVLLDSILQ